MSANGTAAAPSSALRGWLRALLDPRPPGVGAHAPRTKPLAVLIMLGLVALQVKARYDWGFLHDKQWQGVHILLGFAMCFGVITLFHGPSVLRRITWRTWFILGTATGFFLLFWYFGRMDSYGEYWRDVFPRDGAWSPLYAFIYFSLCAALFRLVLPFLTARWVLGRRPGELGLFAPHNPHPPTVRRVWVVYLLLFLAVFPFVVQVSFTAAFQAKYPLCREMVSPEGGIALSHFLVYEAFYLLIFVSGESFWRGYITFGTERDLGHYGLVLMVVPYVTGHFGKPYPETLGAIAAGMTLGFLALKHRSMWLGVALHYAVALSMDLLSIHANGFVIYSG